MKLSIIIPTKNEEHRLPELFASIQESTLKDYEIIVADACSSDHTAQVVLKAGARLVKGGMPGPGRNRGAEIANGTFLLFLDADTLLPCATFLQDCIDEMEKRTLDVAACLPQAIEGTWIDHVFLRTYNLYVCATERVLPHATGFCIFARHEMHNAIHGFDEAVIFAEDHDYAQRAKKAGFHFGILRAHFVPMSVRRMHKEGWFRITLEYIYTELHMIFKGPFKGKKPFDYKFGKFE